MFAAAACITAAVAVSCPACHAGESPYIYRGLRPMGMGGAFTAVSDDANALFYNPAGLALVEKSIVSFFPLEMEISQKTLDMYGGARDVDFDSEQETAEFLRDHMGDQARIAFNLFPHYARRRFAFGLIGTFRLDSEVHDRQYPRIGIHGVSDLGFCAGYAHPILEERLLVGASAKLVRRRSIAAEYSAADIASENFDDAIHDDMKDGAGLLVDIGAVYRLDEAVRGLRAGISMNNLVGSKMQDAEDMPAHVDVGLAFERDLGIVRATFAADYVDVFSRFAGDDDPAKRVRLGAEVRFPAFVSVRAGFHQGYFTFGTTLDVWIARIDALTYAEETGAYAGQKPDRRYAVNIGFGL